MKRTVLTFGVLAGVIIFGYTYLTLALLGILGDFSHASSRQFDMAQVLGYARYLLLLLGVVMAMVAYRRNAAAPVGYRRSLLVGVLVAVVTAVFVGVMEYSYVAFTNPGFYAQYAELVARVMKEKGASAAELEATRQELASYAWVTTPVATGLFYFVETAVIGAVMAAIAAIFIRDKQTTPPSVALNQPT